MEELRGCFFLSEHACTEFRCNLREFCIATDLVCDGTNHCADGSDESSSTICRGELILPYITEFPSRYTPRGNRLDIPDTANRTIMGLEFTWVVVVVITTVLILLVSIVAISICLCRRGVNSRAANNVQQQNTSYSCMYSNLISFHLKWSPSQEVPLYEVPCFDCSCINSSFFGPL